MSNLPGFGSFNKFIGGGFMAVVFLLCPLSVRAEEFAANDILPTIIAPAESVPVVAPAVPAVATEIPVADSTILEKDVETVMSEPATDLIDSEIIKPAETEKPVMASIVLGQTPLPVDQSRDSRSNVLKLNSDQSTGALIYQYDFIFPPGRNGLTPQVSLNYSSQNSKLDNLVGYGWSISIPSIKRVNKTGVENMYSTTTFFSSELGDLKPISVSGTGNFGTYGPEVESGSFIKITYNSDYTWTFTDKVGTRYTYGQTVESRQAKPTDSTKVFAWYLTEVRDKNNNFIRYSYSQDSNQVYPYKIFYTGYGYSDGIFEIEFTKLLKTDSRAYVKQYGTGFEVQTRYHVDQIIFRINSVMRGWYALSYIAGSNGAKELLSSILFTGKDELGVAVSEPATNFTYQHKENTWTEVASSSVNIPMYTAYLDANPQVTGAQIGDLDSDGLDDIFYSKKIYSGPTNWKEAGRYPNLSDGTGWVNTVDTSSIPVYFTQYSGGLSDSGSRLVDANGDGLVDMVADGPLYERGTFINNGNNTWSTSSAYTNSSAGNVPSFYYADVNGDGHVDIVNSYYAYDPYRLPTQVKTHYFSVFLNDPITKTFVQSTSYATPTLSSYPLFFYDFTDEVQNYVVFVDVNSDGFDDIVYSTGDDSLNVWINKGDGTGWAKDSGWVADFKTTAINCGIDTGARFFDINSDGLVDVYGPNDAWSAGSASYAVYLNTGNNFEKQSSSQWMIPDNIKFSRGDYNYCSGHDDGTRFADINGDGQKDIFYYRGYFDPSGGYPDQKKIFLSNPLVSDLMSGVSAASGGSATIEYKAQSQYRDASNKNLNPKSRVNVTTVSKISTFDTAAPGDAIQQTYIYEGAKYYSNSGMDNKFAGFAKVTQTDTGGNKTITYYHQGDTSSSTLGEYEDHSAKIGRPFRTEKYDSSGNLFAKQINRWDRYDLGVNRSFVYLKQAVDFIYDGNSTHKDKGVLYYFSNIDGSLLTKTDYGEVVGNETGGFDDTGSDKYTTTYTYAASSTGYLPGFVSSETVKNQSNVKVKESKYYYDGLAINLVNKGNQTKVEQWVTSTKYIDFEKTYNSYGLVTQEKDPRDSATNYVYDSYNLFPASATNPLGHATSYLYNYDCGQQKQTTDPNLFVTQKTFDGLCRLTEEKMSDSVVTSTIITKTLFVHNQTAGNLYTKRTDNLSASSSLDSYGYYDGLWREIQTRKKSENSSACLDCYSVVDTVYNNLGQVLKKSLPYFSSGASRTSATTTSGLYANFTYDAMSRPTAIQNAVGTTYNAYDDWKLTVTDPRGNPKYLHKDAYGNLTSVQEKNGASTYTTNYLYDFLGSLTKITDSLSNVRNFTYDSIGRRLTAEDLHASSDTTFGKWIYQYDDAGNLATTTDPNGSITTSTYDALNRLLKLDNNATAGVEETYTYDNPAGGKGRLWTYNTDSTQGVLQGWDYFNNGTVKVSAVNLVGTLYRTNYTYDRQGNRLTVANPDSSQIKYTYNIAGLVDNITYKTPTGTAFADIIKNIDYSPANAPTVLVYANNATTTNTYDASALYRLSNKKTESKIGSVNKILQEFKYTYDAGGNITQIISNSLATSTRATSTYTYDPLNRLLTTVNTSASSALNYSQSFTYSAIGNILTKTDQGTYAYTGNAGTSYANPHAATTIGTTTFAYDKKGNVVTSTADGYQYFWDYKNRLYKLTATSTPATALYNYYYNNENIRVRVKQGTTNSHYPSKEFTKTIVTTTNSTTVRYVYFGGDLVAEIVSAPTSTKTYFVHTDHLGSPTIMTTASGTVAESLAYRPFGQTNVDEKSSTDSLARKFLGEYFDSPTDLSYLNARYYNGKQGRFLGQDSAFRALGYNTLVKTITGQETSAVLMNPQSLNSYSYAQNNPIVYNDKEGNFVPLLAAGAYYGVMWIAASTLAITAPLVGGSIYSYSKGDSRTGDAMMDSAMMTNAVSAAGVSGALEVGAMLAPFAVGASGKNDTITNLMKAKENTPITSVMSKKQLGNISPTQDYLNKNKIIDYCNELKQGKNVGTVVGGINSNGQTFILDGHHRYAASRATGINVPINMSEKVEIGRMSWDNVSVRK